MTRRRVDLEHEGPENAAIIVQMVGCEMFTGSVKESGGSRENGT